MTWPGTYLLVVAMLYQQFGDLGPIEKHYASMKKWLDYMRRKYARDDIMTKDKYGDWCVPPESPELIHSKDSMRNTNGGLIATAYYYQLVCVLQDFARRLHKEEDERNFLALSQKIKKAFNARYLDSKTFRYDNNTVTANLLPLCFGMVSTRDRTAVFKNITDKIEKEEKGHISTGVIGSQWLMEGLTDYGRPDLAWRIASNRDYPSWGYMVEQGATTIWELWNGNTADPAMNSHNHIMLLGDLITWFYKDLAGISPGKPGYKAIILKPYGPDGLDEVQASYRTPYGLVKSAWKRQGVKGLVWDITIPANTGATIYLPANRNDSILEGGQDWKNSKTVRFVDRKEDRMVFDIGAGTYHFEIKR
jgi:alpha-L-rhamnosidase